MPKTSNSGLPRGAGPLAPAILLFFVLMAGFFWRPIYSVLTISFIDLLSYTPFSFYGKPANIKEYTSLNCSPRLWNHVYFPARLYVIEPCIAVTGIIVSNRTFADGDNHILFKPDKEFSGLTTVSNLIWGNALVVETICQNPIEEDFGKASEACKNFNYFVEIPPVGSHVRITGTYVLDKHYGWREIHPVTSIEKVN